ncbi:MAG: AAA family ATPase [Candidatus Sedimenticola endophacoides]|uniref:AAA family ATPase n=1 Tax=Candidatus Sedimenticola endophacoides TaxID=2548426 RepID=A0A6N4DUJ3_9GAMM|nr:MAG: AAA family ATPase [Candidatus Sedimenticola endophacoides]OQX35519.1 MAG: AAA family ATPase [Candidatus Sedimenticola endophacoides]OQX40675.1 MAG: AAA family ATPase [Candidatus Sedimenticola endophacoides]PUE00043.1 MAG: AAA family ATPase [Candidatus Sedimenticola endophacoides]PUE01733.1 MAG: AAA family ATPase [Candidatus Sedimenticola endophacoides]
MSEERMQEEAAVLERVGRLEREIGQAVIGQRQVIHDITIALLAGGHALVEGVPGLGKTLLVRSLAAAVGGSFNRVQFTPDLMPSDISGHFMFDMKRDAFRVRKGPVFCNFLLADEINRAPAKTQSALLEVMQERQVTIEGRCFALDPPFLVLATQNPIEQEGTYPLPQAQLDRFLLKVFIDYPGEEEERDMVRRVTAGVVGDGLDVSAVTEVLQPEQIMDLQRYAASLEVDEQIIGYAVRIARATREWSGVDTGCGPRGSLSLLRAARANAVLEGRRFVTPDDVKGVARPVLRHRLKLSADLEIEGYRADDVLGDILDSVEAPRV